MPTNHFAVAGVPATGATALLRSGLVGRYAYCLTNGESAGDFVAIDPNTGDVCPALIQNGALYGLDNADTTTAPGPTCLVSYDGKRYKLNSLTTPFSVLSKASTSPPGSPVIGDAYLLYSTPSGAWSGKIGYIAIYTSRGWEFMLAPVGFRILVEDEGSFYFRDPSGNWFSGLGSVLVPDSSIALSKMIWDGRVQNQTTNTPPSAAQGIAFIIGSSPTGAWAGNAGKIAIRESAGTNSTYVIYEPKVGRTVYDISLASNFVWDGTAWKPQFSGYSDVSNAFLATAAVLAATGTSEFGYVFSDTTAPTIPVDKTVITETHTTPIEADVSGQQIEIDYEASLSQLIAWTLAAPPSSGVVHITAALYVDNETIARDWSLIYLGPGNPASPVPVPHISICARFLISLANTSSHTATVRFHFCAGGGASARTNNVSMGLARRNYIVRKRR